MSFLSRHGRHGVLIFALAYACGGIAVIDGDGESSGTAVSGSQTSGTSGGPYADCGGPGECTLTYPGCCSWCATPNSQQVVSVNASQLDGFRAQQCPEPEPCNKCGACPNGALFGWCNAGTCQVGDLSRPAFSECEEDTDCRLRNGSDCCESCGEVQLDCSALTAVNVEADSKLKPLVCKGMIDCPLCAPQYPEGAVARCVQGLCAVTVE